MTFKNTEIITTKVRQGARTQAISLTNRKATLKSRIRSESSKHGAFGVSTKCFTETSNGNRRGEGVGRLGTESLAATINRETLASVTEREDLTLNLWHLRENSIL